MSRFCLTLVGDGRGGVRWVTIVIASNRVSGCGLEVKWGHGSLRDF